MLGDVLGLLVEPEEMVDPRPVGLVRRVALLGPVQADRADRARVDESLDACGHRRVDHVQAPADVHFVEFLRVSGPEPVERGDMEDQAASLGRGQHGRTVTQISLDALDLEVIHTRVRDTGLEESHDLGTARQQGPGDR